MGSFGLDLTLRVWNSPELRVLLARAKVREAARKHAVLCRVLQTWQVLKLSTTLSHAMQALMIDFANQVEHSEAIFAAHQHAQHQASSLACSSCCSSLAHSCAYKLRWHRALHCRRTACRGRGRASSPHEHVHRGACSDCSALQCCHQEGDSSCGPAGQHAAVGESAACGEPSRR